MIIVLLQLSLGVGLDLEKYRVNNSRDLKAIIQVQQNFSDYSVGFWHSSQIDSGSISASSSFSASRSSFKA